MGFFLETLIGGLMFGMLYSLVALGFVLIFKASGVFNFAQGTMVLFAALAMARFAEWIAARSGLESKWLVNVLAFVVAMAIMVALAWIIGLTEPLFALLGQDYSGRDLILLGGGLFLLWKSVSEIHELLEGSGGQRAAGAGASFAAILAQIMAIDVIFSLDSIITAVGMVKVLLTTVLFLRMSAEKKKNSFCRDLLNRVPGMISGPPMVPPGF